MRPPNKPKIAMKKRCFCEHCKQRIKQGKLYFSRAGKAYHYPACPGGK